jgi:hypothetical protein
LAWFVALSTFIYLDLPLFTLIYLDLVSLQGRECGTSPGKPEIAVRAELQEL